MQLGWLLALSLTVALPTGRTYVLAVPSVSAPSAGYPVVLNFHGLGGTALQQEQLTGMTATGEAKGFVTVYPQGVNNAFNAGDCCMTGVDDVAFTRAILADLAKRMPIDRRRVYATGFSNGAMMVYRLACEAPDLVAAIAPVSGAMSHSCQPTIRVPVVHFHATNDPVVPYEGNRPSSVSGAVYQGVVQGLAKWLAPNACRATPLQVAAITPTYTCYAVSGCPVAPAGTGAITLCVNTGTPASEAHTWNAATWNRWANAVMWDYVFAPSRRD